MLIHWETSIKDAPTNCPVHQSENIAATFNDTTLIEVALFRFYFNEKGFPPPSSLRVTSLVGDYVELSSGGATCCGVGLSG